MNNISIFVATALKTNIHIRLKALFLLLVFSANVSAVCHCNHALGKGIVATKKESCCAEKKINTHCKNKKNGCKEKGCCSCEKKIVKFQQIEKQVSQKIALAAIAVTLISHHHSNSLVAGNYQTTNPSKFPKEKYWYYSPPDYCILYHRFRI